MRRQRGLVGLTGLAALVGLGSLVLRKHVYGSGFNRKLLALLMIVLGLMAAGRIIVAWDNPTYRQILNSQCAFMVPQGSTEHLVRAFRSIADDPACAAEYGKLAREQSRKFDWASHLDRFLRLVPFAELRHERVEAE